MKRVLVFGLALIITLLAAIYQKLTGPTYPIKFTYSVSEQTYKAKLIRSGGSHSDTQIILELPISALANLYYKKYRVNEEYTQVTFMPINANQQAAYLPKMPSAAKLEYYIEITDGPETIAYFRDNPVVIRYKNPVPAWALVPHIIIMFLTMLFSNLTGLQAIFRMHSYKTNGMITLALLFLGGMILGPIVQKFAFGEFWTGFPFGYDLTDNKTLIAFVAWIVAVWLNHKETRPAISIFAALVTIVVFSIPHSLLGSELNYETGKVVTGFIKTLMMF